MPLSSEAAAILAAAADRMPIEMNQMDLQVLRDLTGSPAAPSTTEVFAVGDVMVPSPEGAVPIRVYQPSASTSRPVMMWMHGGGFAIGSLDMSDEWLRQMSLAAGVVIVSVDYRLAPQHPYPAGLDDCLTVWAWLQGNPVEVPGDCSRLACGGESAGGTLAFALALVTRDRGGRVPDAVVSYYGSAEMRVSNPDCSTPPILTARDCIWFWDMYVPRGSELRNSPYASPGKAESLAGHAPTLVVTAEVDPTRDCTEDYARRMQDEGVDVVLRRYDGVMHGFGSLTGALAQAKDALRLTADFLEQRLARLS